MGKENKLTKREWYILLLAGICIAVTLCITLLHDYSEGVENSPEEIYDERLLSIKIFPINQKNCSRFPVQYQAQERSLTLLRT